MRGFVVAALALAVVMPSQGGQPLIKVDVSLGDVSINKVPQLVAAELGRRGEHDLELSARRLAWSADDPAYEDTSALARDVRLAAESNGSGH